MVAADMNGIARKNPNGPQLIFGELDPM